MKLMISIAGADTVELAKGQPRTLNIVADAVSTAFLSAGYVVEVARNGSVSTARKGSTPDNAVKVSLSFAE